MKRLIRLTALSLLLLALALPTLSGCGKLANPVADDPDYETWTCGDFSISYPAAYTVNYSDAESLDVDVPDTGDFPASFSVYVESCREMEVTSVEDFDEEYAKALCDEMSELYSGGGDSISASTEMRGIEYKTYGAKKGAKIDYSVTLSYSAPSPYADTEGYTVTIDVCQILIIDGDDLFAVCFAAFIDSAHTATCDETFAKDVYPYIFCE